MKGTHKNQGEEELQGLFKHLRTAASTHQQQQLSRELHPDATDTPAHRSGELHKQKEPGRSKISKIPNMVQILKNALFKWKERLARSMFCSRW